MLISPGIFVAARNVRVTSLVVPSQRAKAGRVLGWESMLGVFQLSSTHLTQLPRNDMLKGLAILSRPTPRGPWRRVLHGGRVWGETGRRGRACPDDRSNSGCSLS